MDIRDCDTGNAFETSRNCYGFIREHCAKSDNQIFWDVILCGKRANDAVFTGR